MVAKPVALWHSKATARVFGPVCRLTLLGCGCSSGVEHNLAKVGVEGSNPFARSKKISHSGRPLKYVTRVRVTPGNENTVGASQTEAAGRRRGRARSVFV
jgi:hypothetical protein